MNLGEAFCAAMKLVTGRTNPGPEDFERAAAEYEKVRSALPDDIEAFVAKCDARARKATPGPWLRSRTFVGRILDRTMRDAVVECVANGDRTANAVFVSKARTDVPSLCAIIREMGMALANLRRAHEYLVGREAFLLEQLRLAQFDTQTAMNTTERVERENVALRERLVSIETEVKRGFDWLGPEYFCDGKPFETLRKLVDYNG